MRLLTSALVLAILATVGFCQPECRPDCYDEYTRCNTKERWYPEDCYRDNVRDHCHLMCGICQVCPEEPTEPVEPEEPEDTSDDDSGPDRSFGYPMNCPAPIQDFDASGYRLALRHTGQQINVDQFFQLYETGDVDGFFSTCPQSQYKDENMHFFWGETSDVVLDIFDDEGNRAAYVNFGIPLGSEHPPFYDIFQWQYIHNAGDQHYHDIHSGGEVDIDFKPGNQHRNLYMASYHRGCDNDRIWFGVLNNKGVCWWDKEFSKSGDKEKTTIVYSPYNKAAHAFTSLAVASRFEMRLGGDFYQDAQNGYRKVLRYPNGAGVDFMGFYEDGITSSLEDAYPSRAGDVKPGLFRSGSFESDITNAENVMVVVYDANGDVAEALAFKGSNGLFGWFSEGNLVSNLKWKLNEGDFNFFSVKGDDGAGRRMFINRPYNFLGCLSDNGFLIVSCMRPNENDGICDWEDFSRGVKENREFLCSIMYTPSDNAVTWNTYDYLIGSAIEIFVR